MRSASKVLLILLRLGELVCGAVVLGLLGRVFYLINDSGVLEPEGRLIYAAVVASLTILNSLAFILPFAYSYFSFPLDFIFFILWIVVFGLLESLTGIRTCYSSWFNNYWGYYWGRGYYVSPPSIEINWTGCNAWRTVLAFSFIASMVYLANGLVGVYWTLEYGNIRARSKSFFARKRDAPVPVRTITLENSGLTNTAPARAAADRPATPVNTVPVPASFASDFTPRIPTDRVALTSVLQNDQVRST